MDDALVQDDGIDLIVEELDRCWEVTQDQDKSVEDRKGPLRDTKGRQNGDDLHVLCGTEEASLSTLGKCTGDATTSSDQGLRVLGTSHDERIMTATAIARSKARARCKAMAKCNAKF